jgi:hypothetical protein
LDGFVFGEDLINLITKNMRLDRRYRRHESLDQIIDQGLGGYLEGGGGVFNGPTHFVTNPMKDWFDDSFRVSVKVSGMLILMLIFRS